MSNIDIESYPFEDTAYLSSDASQATPTWASVPIRRIVKTPAVEERLIQRHRRSVLLRLALFALDAVMINVGFIGAYFLRFGMLHGVRFTTVFIDEPLESFRSLEALTTAIVLAAFAVRGLYSLRATGTWFRQLGVILSGATIAFGFYLAYFYVVGKGDLAVDNRSRSLVVLSWVTIIAAVGLGRLVAAGVLALLYRYGFGLTTVLVVGSGRLAKLMMQQLSDTPHLGYRVVGFLHDQDGPALAFGRFQPLGNVRDVDRVFAQQRIDEVIIALPSYQHHLIMRTMRHCERAGADYRLVPHLYELSLSRVVMDSVRGIPLIGVKRPLDSARMHAVKRGADVIGALLLLAITAPIWLLTALAIKLDSPGPVLLRQTRVGRRGRSFTCLKFRSMRTEADRQRDALLVAKGTVERGKFKLRNDPRRTRVGVLIRRTSIDELPQLLNVLRGEMSLVGPRPPLPTEYARYEDWEKARLETIPGLTGLWQVRGRSDLDFNEMVLMDLYYIEHWSLGLDLQILLQTIPAVIRQRGAY